MNPYPAGHEPSGVRLSLQEREDIAALRAGGAGVRGIARELGRSPSTISRELARNSPATRPYRASTAQRLADRRAARPKERKLSPGSELWDGIVKRLKGKHSPEQIAARLRKENPDDPELHVSHETIYKAIYVMPRGELKREVLHALRTGRTRRKPRRATGERRGKIPGMVNISERPPEVEDRAVPGHWEGDLIVGTGSASAIGTLVERTTGYVVLLHLAGDHTAATVQDAIVAAMAALPATLKRTLTWDQGVEMANHVAIAAATGLDIYFCDPRSPWQRGSNENTNGLLRQYFPKGTDLSLWGPGILEQVAAELNNRPRKRLDWDTPAEALDRLLSTPTETGVAPTP